MSGSGQALYQRARGLIPGGTQLLSKRPEMFLPDLWPAYYSKASGADVWDLDGNRYLDMSYCGIGSTILGFADPDVNQAVHQAVDAGSMSTLNCPEEVELGELLCELHPWSSMVRFARSGGEAMAIAVRIARARTRRDVVAFCGYHGWHDWYLAANLADDQVLDGHLLPGLEPAGVPRGLSGTAIPFEYNRIADLENLVGRHGGRLAAIVMEPVRGTDPEPGFLETVRELATRSGAVLIFDEVTAGFRVNSGGIHLQLGIDPDIAVFAKAISNGYPMAAIVGTSDVMQACQSSFISSTSWTERIGSVAALATINKHIECNVPDHLIRIGTAIRDGWRDAADRYQLQLSVSGIAPLSHFSFEGYENAQAMLTLFVQLMLEEGILAKNSFYAMYAHSEQDVQRYLKSLDRVFGEIAAASRNNRVEALLLGPEAHTGFRRLT